MARVKVRLNMAGVREVLNDDGVIADLMQRGERIASAADAAMPEHGYTKSEHHTVAEGRTSRGNRDVVVVTSSNMAKGMQAKHSTLTQALDAGRS
jgi:hypothetical protein